MFSFILFLQVRGHLQGCGKIHGASGVAVGAAKFLLGKGMRLIKGVQVNKGKSLDNKMPVVSQAHVGKKMPRRSRRFGQVLKGENSRSKQQCTNQNLDVNLDVSAPINVTVHLPNQYSTVRENDDTPIPPQANSITQLRRKVQNSTVRNKKLTQLVAELKNEVRDLKRHAKESDAAHTKLVADLKVKDCELLREKQRDKKSVNNVSVCHQLINFLNEHHLTFSSCFQILSVKLNEIETIRSNLHKKEKSVDVSMMNAKKDTATMIHAERAFASAKIEGMLKRNKAAVEQERNGNKATIALKDSLLAKKDDEIKKLKAKVTQLQTKHKAKRCKQADIINCKNDSIKEQTCIHKKNICEMNNWMAEGNKERESAVSLLIKSKEKLLASKNAANAMKVKLNRKEDKLLEHQRLSATLQRRCEQLERSLVELDMEKSEYIAELEYDCAQAIEELNVSTCYMASFNLHFMLSKSCLYQFLNRN